MLRRKYLFPHVIEMNYQAGRRLGVNVYLIDGGSEFLLIDIGFLDTVDEIVELIRQMDFNLSTCKMVIATHADATVLVNVVAAEEKIAQLETELAGGVAGGVPDFQCQVADLDRVPFVENKVDLATRHGDLDALGLDRGVGHDLVGGLQGLDAEWMGRHFRL